VKNVSQMLQQKPYLGMYYETINDKCEDEVPYA